MKITNKFLKKILLTGIIFSGLLYNNSFALGIPLTTLPPKNYDPIESIEVENVNIEEVTSTGETSFIQKIISKVNADTLNNEKVLLIQDYLPWQSNANIEELNNLGIAYDSINSNSLPDINLDNYKAIIIASDQPSGFYNIIRQHKARWDRFVENGGLLVSHNSDMGWQGGNSTGVLPGGVGKANYYKEVLQMRNINHPLIKGEASSNSDISNRNSSYFYNWYWSTHGYFYNLYTGTDKVIDTGDTNIPTYIDYKYGKGRVLATMQTLEFGYAYLGKREILKNEFLIIKNYKRPSLSTNTPDFPITNINYGSYEYKNTNVGVPSVPTYTPDVGDPVNISNGRFDYGITLLSLKGVGIHYNFKIKYSNQVSYEGNMGFNWSHNYNLMIYEGNSGSLIFLDENFSPKEFKKLGNNNYRNETLRASLSKENQLYKITFDNGKTYYFNDINKISKIEDKNGNTLSYFYDEDKKLIKTIDTLGKEINYIYNSAFRLEKITTSNNDEVIFTYNENKDLVNIKTGKNGNLKEIKFEYITGNANDKLNHNITKLIDSKGQTYVENTYDELDRVIIQKYGNGNVNYNYTTNENGKVIKNNVTNRNGVKTEYSFDENGNTISRKVQTSNGIVEFKFQYDSNGRITKDIQPNGNSLEYSYDNLGRMLSKKEVGETIKTTTYEYNSDFETPTKITKANGMVIENSLDEKGNVIKTKVINGNEVLETTYEYDNAGQLIQTINPNGLKTSLEYQNGNVVKITKQKDSIFSSEKIESQFEYDNEGNIIKVIDGNGNAKTLTYNDFNQIIQSISAEGVINSFDYDGNGNATKQTQNLDNTIDINITKTYDILDHISEVNTPISAAQISQTKFEYDGNENVKKITLPNGTTKEFFYNEFDKVVKVNSNGVETKYEYDNNGNITKIIDAKLNAKNLEYNLFNEVVKITDELGNITNLTYDTSGKVTKIEVYNKNGNLLSKQEKVYDLLGNTLKEIRYNLDTNTQITTSYTYNKGLLVGKIDSLGNETTLNYDEFGRTISTIDSLGNKQTFEYDKNSNITKKSIISNTGKTINTYYLYDKDNRVIGEKSDDNILKGYIYNNLNQITTVIDKNGNKTILEYNYIGKVTKKIQYVNGKNIETNFEYDVNGNLIAVIDGNGNKTTYIYDDFNRLIKEVYADEKQVTYEYDLLGNIIKKTDPNGNIISNIYDNSNRLIERNISNPAGIVGTVKENYTYDDLGRLINSKSIDNTGKTIETSFTYNSLNQLTSETNNGKTIKYEYDTNGNQVKVIYPSGKVVTKSYDEINRLKNISLDTKNITNYNYSGLELVNQINGNNTKTNYSYDDLGRLQTLKNISLEEVRKGKTTSIGENIINDFVFSYDNIGNITGNGLENYNYDEISRLINVNIPDTNIKNDRKNIEVNTSFLYDNVGNRDLVEQTTTWETKRGKDKEKVKIADYTNNSLNQYTSLENYTEKDEKDTKKNKVKNFVYDNNGNLVNDGKQKYEYDYRNRLVKVTNLKNETISEYSYDTFGRRVLLRQDYEGQVAKKVVSYTYAGNNAILEESFELEEDKLELKESKENIYSNSIDDILASIITKDGKSKVYYYTKNQLGGITAITDEKGKVIEEYKYDVFGKAYIRNGKSDNWKEFKESKIDNTRLFTGREYDREIGLYYYRARYYSAELGRFISRDPIGQVDDINLYSYVGNNSVNFVDPFGKEKKFIADHDATKLLEEYMNNAKEELSMLGLIPEPTAFFTYSFGSINMNKWNIKFNQDFLDLAYNPNENNESCSLYKNGAGMCEVYIGGERWKLDQIGNFLVGYNGNYAGFSLDNIYDSGMFIEVNGIDGKGGQSYEDALIDELQDRPWYDRGFYYASYEKNQLIDSIINLFN